MENQKQTEDNINLTTHENKGDNYIRVEMQFNSLMTEFFEGSDIVVVVVIYFYSLTIIQYENKTNKKIIIEKSYNNNILQNKLKE